MRRKINDGEARKMLKAGKSQKEIAEHFGVSKSTLSGFLKRRGRNKMQREKNIRISVKAEIERRIFTGAHSIFSEGVNLLHEVETILADSKVMRGEIKATIEKNGIISKEDRKSLMEIDNHLAGMLDRYADYLRTAYSQEQLSQFIEALKVWFGTVPAEHRETLLKDLNERRLNVFNRFSIAGIVAGKSGSVSTGQGIDAKLSTSDNR